MGHKLRTTCVFFVAVTIMLVPQAFAGEKVESEFGLTTSYYRYQEPNVMSLRAVNIGLNYIGTLVFQNDWFIRGDLAATISGGAKYSSNGTGSMNNVKNWYTDIRALFGRNFEFKSSSLSPYAGFGYRYLDNNSEGMVTTTGNSGYRRASNYYYLPIGITHQVNLSSQSKLVTNIEFDYLTIGKQVNYFSDFSIVQTKYGKILGRDITNTQKKGYGARFSTMCQINNWLIGPYLTYWRINTSDGVVVPTIDTNNSVVYYEPKNNTIEAGLKISYKLAE
ncbi:conserved exported hypothetical protein [Gammaproteobacteria bacterium]